MSQDSDEGNGQAENDRTAGVCISDTAAHLEDVPDGAGCTEIWEHLSEQEEHDAK